MIEAGYRCAICKETSGLDIEHIIEWAEVLEHKFENMIVLCAVCHRRKSKTSDPRHINRASLQKIKSNLMLLNGRYSDLERRITETFQEQLACDPQTIPFVILPEVLYLLVKYLVDDAIVTKSARYQGAYRHQSDGTVLNDADLRLTLTPKGRQFILDPPRVKHAVRRRRLEVPWADRGMCR
jgi:hypothetical protein